MDNSGYTIVQKKQKKRYKTYSTSTESESFDVQHLKYQICAYNVIRTMLLNVLCEDIVSCVYSYITGYNDTVREQLRQLFYIELNIIQERTLNTCLCSKPFYWYIYNEDIYDDDIFDEYSLFCKRHEVYTIV